MQVKFKDEFGKLDEYVYSRKGLYKNRLGPKRSIKKIKKLKYDELPSPVIDTIFKIMFCKSTTKKYACKLFGTILDIENMDDFKENIILIRNELEKVWLDGSVGHIDFIGEYKGVYFNLEMNRTNKTERNTAYAYKISLVNEKESKEVRTRIINEGKKIYNYVIQMNINDYTLLRIDNPIDINVTSNRKYLRTKIIFIDVYLPLINEKYKTEGIEKLTDTERTILGMFIGKYQKAIELGKEDKEMLKFIKNLKELKNDKRIMAEYYSYDEAIETGYEHGLEEGLEQGLEQGENNGRKQEKEEIVMNMLKEGINPETIHRCTKLPLKKISKMMNLL